MIDLNKFDHFKRFSSFPTASRYEEILWHDSSVIEAVTVYMGGGYYEVAWRSRR